ncbi:heparinase II/III family protein [Woodsholea maritima]|uniref:heparinase II/III family protein n=1 Tax=Woodsholea maritima TaxID=240237 RepID=UPI00036E3E7E|nr:heparinase II/III family protein [Woodsholea maritima]
MAKPISTVDLLGSFQRRVRQDFSDFANTVPLYRMVSLSGPVPEGFKYNLLALYSASEERGQQVIEGEFYLAGEHLSVHEGESPWTQPAPSKRFAASLHAFRWLPHLIALKDEGALALAQNLLDDWILHFGRWNWFAWAPKVAARRLRYWLSAGSPLFEGGEASQRAQRFQILYRHVRHILRSLELMEDDSDKLFAVLTSLMAALALGLDEAALNKAETQLQALLNAQILPDGGHCNRNPATAGRVLCELVILKDLAGQAGYTLHKDILRTLDRLAPFVRFFQAGDTGLAAFNGGGQSDASAIHEALARAGVKANPFGVAPHSSYHRAEAHGALVILDAGGAPKGAHSVTAHAGALAFEFFAADHRIVVNCGWSDDQPSQWREVVRATPAHSTLTLEEISSVRSLEPGWARRMLGPRLIRNPDPIKARRNEEDKGVWLEATHDGYRQKFGLSVRRRLFLATDGGDLRGEDALYRPVEDGPSPDPEQRYSFAIRFHLHPDVKASLSRDSMSALLVLSNGEGWRFRTDGGPVRLERSVYLAKGAQPLRSTQLVVSGEAEPFGAGDRPPNRVRWAFQRLGRVGSAG